MRGRAEGAIWLPQLPVEQSHAGRLRIYSSNFSGLVAPLRACWAADKLRGGGSSRAEARLARDSSQWTYELPPAPSLIYPHEPLQRGISYT